MAFGDKQMTHGGSKNNKLFLLTGIIKPGFKKTPTPPLPAPQVRQTANSGLDASLDARRRTASRRGLGASVLAGETYSGTSYSTAFGQRSLLGAK